MGNFWSDNSESLLDVRNNFLQAPTVMSFSSLEDRLSWCEKHRLGYSYKIWRTACLYTFMMNNRTNLTSDGLICDFRDMEHDTIEAFENEQDWAVYPMLILWKVTGRHKYEKIIKNVQNVDFTSTVNSILTDSML
jgi:hypothetical protein